MPAFHEFLGAFAQLQRLESLASGKAPEPVRLELEWLNVKSGIPPPKSIAFFDSLLSVDAQEISEDRRDCAICVSPFASLYGKDVDNAVIALRLPCGHLLCQDCLWQWFRPARAKPDNNTCPHCRTVCFPKLADVHTTEGLQERVDMVDWIHRELGCRLSDPLLQSMTLLRNAIAWNWYREAAIEAVREGQSIWEKHELWKCEREEALQFLEMQEVAKRESMIEHLASRLRKMDAFENFKGRTVTLKVGSNILKALRRTRKKTGKEATPRLQGFRRLEGKGE